MTYDQKLSEAWVSLSRLIEHPTTPADMVDDLCEARHIVTTIQRTRAALPNDTPQEKDTMAETILKTSEEWQDEIKDFCTILDPDGWDRLPEKCGDSWNEPISKKVFGKRLVASTIRADIPRLLEWSEEI